MYDANADDRTRGCGVTAAVNFTIATPVGEIVVTPGAGNSVAGIAFGKDTATGDAGGNSNHPLAVQLREYFAGERKVFDISYRFPGTDFQRAVWREIEKIPFGETLTYGDIARAITRPGAMRAVGLACGQNPFSIIVPCHRVVGAGSKLTGYGGGLWRKRWLLAFERRDLLSG